MKSNRRTLQLRAEKLAELSNEELARIEGAGAGALTGLTTGGSRTTGLLEAGLAATGGSGRTCMPI